MREHRDLAKANFAQLRANEYPGRGIVVGISETGKHLVQVYWIMGRSQNSRNRVFRHHEETGCLFTEAADPTRIEDPSLIFYNAMREREKYYVVSNGSQTDVVYEATIKMPFSLESALREVQYEPDAPNFTPRITTVCELSRGRPLIAMSILRKSEFSDACDKFVFELNPDVGYGYCITTYIDDGSPLPSFRGEPLLMPLRGSAVQIADAYWSVLNPENCVALAVKWIEMRNGRSDITIINKYTKVTA